jgi:hypothetical protein
MHVCLLQACWKGKIVIPNSDGNMLTSVNFVCRSKVDTEVLNSDQNFNSIVNFSQLYFELQTMFFLYQLAPGTYFITLISATWHGYFFFYNL